MIDCANVKLFLIKSQKKFFGVGKSVYLCGYNYMKEGHGKQI